MHNKIAASKSQVATRSWGRRSRRSLGRKWFNALLATLLQLIFCSFFLPAVLLLLLLLSVAFGLGWWWFWFGMQRRKVCSYFFAASCLRPSRQLVFSLPRPRPRPQSPLSLSLARLCLCLCTKSAPNLCETIYDWRRRFSAVCDFYKLNFPGVFSLPAPCSSDW